MAAEENSPILRIKRKRTEDPLDALLVAQVYKKPCIADSDGSDQGTALSKNTDQTVERLFRYVGTVPQGANNRGKDLLTKLHSQPDRHKNLGKNHVHSTERLQEMLRQKRKLLHQESRFKVISSYRPNGSCRDSQSDSSEDLSQDASEKATASSSSDAVDDGVDDDVDLEVQRLFSVYDLVRDEDTEDQRKRREERKSRKDQQSEEVNTILCNSMKMIREKLTVSEDQFPKKADNGFVYDFYCPSDSYGKLGEIVEVLPFDSELVHERLQEDFGEIYDDDDDSNDEANWRNDYPDEDDSDSDSSLHRKYEDYGFDSDEEYQRHAFQEGFSSGED